MPEYTSLNSDLILKKTNSILGQKITDFPQYKSALPKDFKYPRNDLPNIQPKEWFDDKKKLKSQMTFKSVKTSTISAAASLGYLFIPGLRFKSISQGNTSYIQASNISASKTISQVLTDTNNSKNGLDKTIAIMYTGSGSSTIPRKCYYMRQFWLEDIELIPPNLQTGNKDAGIFFRSLTKVYDIINEPENLSNYDWINDGTTDNNKNIMFNDKDYNLFDNLYFIMCFNNASVYNNPDPDFIGQLQLSNKKADTSVENLNKAALFRLVKVDTGKTTNSFYLQYYNNTLGKWYGTWFEDISSNTPVLKKKDSAADIDKLIDLILIHLLAGELN